jgi:hypothetical protein
MFFNDSGGDAEAQPRALLFAGKKGLEDFILHRARDAGTGILNLNTNNPTEAGKKIF